MSRKQPNQTEYKQACRTVLEFRKKYFEIPWSRFERLRRYGYPSLNRKHFGPSLEKASASQRRSQNPVIKLAAWIREDERAVLDAMGLGKRWFEAQSTAFRFDPSNRTTQETRNVLVAMGLNAAHSKPIHQHDNNDSILSKLGTSPEANLKCGLILAERGQGKLAFDLLVSDFLGCTQLDEPSTLQLAQAVYISYRYLDTSMWINPLSRVVEKLKTQKRRMPDAARAVCLSQIACALSEAGDCQRAGELFTLPAVRELVKESKEILWNKAQLMRRVANYHLLESQTSKATALFDDAKELEPSPANSRSEAMFNWFVDIMRGPGSTSFNAAWGSMREEYLKSRTKLLIAAENDARATDAIPHIFAVVQHGAIARQLAPAANYPKLELAEDCYAMNWYIRRFGGFKIVLSKMLSAFSGLEGELAIMTAKCQRLPLGILATETLEDLGSLLM